MRAILSRRLATLALALVLGACAPRPAATTAEATTHVEPGRQSRGGEAGWASTPVLGVTNVKTAMDFYMRALGFRSVVLVPGVDPGEGGVYGIVDRGGAFLHLQIRRQRGAVEREPLEQDAEVRVNDVTDLFEEYKRAGVAFVAKTRNGKTSAFGERDFTVQDPDGNLVTFAAAERR